MATMPPPGLLEGQLPGDPALRLEQYRRKKIVDALGQTWPAQAAKSAYGAFNLPGDVYAGKTDPNSEDAIRRSADLAGMLTLGAGAVPAAANDMRMGIKVYHGSPHDFDKFELSDKTIGTGEGAQAYGHGLYFAENEGVAKGYKEALVKAKNEANPAFRLARDWQEQFSSPEQARKELDDWIEMFRKRGDEKSVKEYEAVRDVMDNPNLGKTYEAELNASPDDFLDWDKPLSEQPKKVQAILKDKNGPWLEGGAGGSWRMRGSDYWKYRTSPGMNNPAELAAKLKEYGIKGIRYLDAGSRVTPDELKITQEGVDYWRQALKNGGGELAQKRLDASIEHLKRLEERAANGTNNYVVFDDKIIDIIKKYGIAGLIAGGTGVAAIGGGNEAQAAPAVTKSTPLSVREEIIKAMGDRS